MISSFHQKFVIDTIDKISGLTLVPQIAGALTDAAAQFGFSALGINSLPSPGEDADPFILTESTPEGFRELYIAERFYAADHICRHARTAYEPFRYSEAPYGRTESRGHQRFMQALASFGMDRGLIVPIGRPANIPACLWLAGKNPDLDDESMLATQIICLFAASKAHALAHASDRGARSSLTPREREVLQWIAAGKTSWEISVISGLTERAINKIIADAMIKLNAVTRAQAVVNAIRNGAIAI
jgi:LuxR family quorum sensing-dependent transcriptional regulator